MIYYSYKEIVMKFLLAILLSLSVGVATASEFEFDPKPMVVVGHRFGNSELNGNGAFYVSAKMNLFQKEVKDFKTLNFMSLGLNYQDDKKWAMSVSPISISSLSGMTFGVDYIPKTKEVNGDVFGVFIGIKFP